MNKNRKLAYGLNLQQFADVMNATTSATTGNDLRPEIKQFYDKNLIRLAEPYLVHDRFAQQKPIPRGNGKTISFRKFSKLPKALTPLTEGVTPDGQALNVSEITATVAQYGGYVKITDVLQLASFDPIITEATELIAQQAGRTLDTITREILNGGTNVQYADGTVASRAALTASNTLTVKAVQLAATALKAQDADSDTISRKAAIDAILAVTGNSSVRELYEHVQEHGLSDMWSGGVNAAIDIIIAVPSAQPEKRTEERTETHSCDCISRKAAIDALDKRFDSIPMEQTTEILLLRKDLRELPSAQPEPLSDAYIKAVWTWLLNYQIKAAELQGRYTPYEVLSWVANDWRKEHE